MWFQVEDVPFLPEYTPLFVTVAAFVLAVVVVLVFDLEQEWSLVLFTFGIVSVGTYCFGYDNPLLLVVGIFAIGIAVYAKFIHGNASGEGGMM